MSSNRIDGSIHPGTGAKPFSFFSEYQPLAGAYDECCLPNGSIRKEWQSVVARLDSMGLEELSNRWQQARTQISRDGVTFNPHDSEGTVSRPWLLDAIPLVFAESAWQSLSLKLAQRARLMEALLSDLFGDQRLLKERIIPPDLVFGHPAWYPVYQQLYASGHRFLDYYVSDLARDTDGKWWVTGDRVKSPFGLGYSLENRIVTSRMLSGILRKVPVKRLAPFYATMKEQLRQLAPRFRDNPRIVLWSKGPKSRSYFEDSYLSRYLGYTLAEGGDLAIRGESVQLKTLGGLLPVEVLFRRLDDDDCDPIELNPGSEHGVPGLLETIRSGKIAVTNSIGSRLIESPAFVPYLPAISRFLLSEELQLPSVPTWWCGESSAMEHVLRNLDTMIVRPAFRTTDEPPLHSSGMSAQQRNELEQKIRAEPTSYVAQSPVHRSTAPVLVDGKVVPWYLALRAFLIHSDSGFRSLPGGLARVSPQSENLNFTMTSGERTQDVWILTQHHEPEISLLDAPTTMVQPRRSGSELPSRVADNMFWLGRYIERAEQTCRLFRTVFESFESELPDGPEHQPLLRSLAEHGHIEPDHAVPELRRMSTELIDLLPESLFDLQRPMGLRSTIASATYNAVRVRDRISPDMWRTIDRIKERMKPETYGKDLRDLDVMDMLDRMLADFAAFSGLAAESMTRTLAWRFLDLGQRLERTAQINGLIKNFFCQVTPGGDPVVVDPAVIETVLKITNSLMTYRSRYLATYQIPVVLDLLITDSTNPRSILFQIQQINQHLDAMPHGETQAMLNSEQRHGLAMANAVRLADIFELSEADASGRRLQLQKLTKRLDDQLPRLSDELSGRFLIHAGLTRHFAMSNPHLHRVSNSTQAASGNPRRDSGKSTR
ncbi:MAG: circularly permuted type 2 ATP-grasp protein [Planctomycetaceae bacterium]